ncbi:uncharacterized protein ACRADG_005682 [Cochliomyia hominivorax]
MSPNTQVATQTPPVNNHRFIVELKMKYESSPVFETPKNANKPDSPKKTKKSKVKQLASMFNSKISQIIKREGEAVKYSTLINEFSPEAKPQPTAVFVKPVPKPRTRFTKPKAPVPTPRMKTLAKLERNPSGCFAAENEFAKLTVKAKAQLYTQFVEEFSKKNSKSQTVEEKSPNGEVVNEKQATVKDLLEELEFNCVFPKPNKKGTKALQRMDSMKRALEARKHTQVVKAQEYEDILVKKDNPTIKEKKSKSLPRITNEIAPKKELEDLLFSWFKLKHEQNQFKDDESNQSEIDEEKQKSAIDKLLEEAISKLETIEADQNGEEKPIPMSHKQRITKTESSSSNSESAKPSTDEESESGLSSLPKSTSEESQTENRLTKTDNSENDFVFAKPLKPIRKRKLRRNPVFKKDVSQKACNQFTSTDSETDNKEAEIKLKSKRNQSTTVQLNETQLEPETSCVELDQSLLRAVNSPRKIKSAYTLTVNDLETPLNTPRSSLNFAKRIQTHRQIMANNTLTDQGFETATNDIESPLKKSLTQESELSYSSPLSSTKNNFGFSTPIKTPEQHSFSISKSAKQQLFSPIAKPMKNRRKSIYEIESRRNSLAMQVIQEDQPYESPNILNKTEQKISQNIAKEVENEAMKNATEKTSQFWIKCGDFSVALEINFNDAERLRLLYEIFSQTSCDTKDLHFGIDDQKFSVHGPLDGDNISTRIPASKGCSHYWFSTGDLAIPFSGRYLPTHKIQRIFRVIKETVEETGILRFGVDEVEFSNVPEFWYQPAKFSVESQYSMLVGLQSGDSNGLEGRSKYAWPHSKPDEESSKFGWPHSKPVIISDLDESFNECDKFEEIECGRLSYSPFGSNHYDLSTLDQEELSMPRNSQAMMSLESYCGNYESEPIEHLFEDSFSQESQKECQSSPSPVPIAEMVSTVQNEQKRLSLVQEQLSNYVKPSFIAKDSLDELKGTPEYLQKLKSIVTDISNIGCSNNFKECSLEELESYMHFLSRYAEICLSSCNKHMDTVLDALVDYKAVVV